MELVKVYNSLNLKFPEEFSKEYYNMCNKSNKTLFFNLKGGQHRVKKKLKKMHQEEQNLDLNDDQNSSININKEQSGNEQIEEEND